MPGARRLPPGVGIAVNGCGSIVRREVARQSEIVAVNLVDALAKFLETGDIGSRQLARSYPARGPASVARRGPTVWSYSFTSSSTDLQRRFIVGMPEPMIGVQRRVGLYRTPAQVARTIDDIPVLEVDLAALRAHPAHVRHT